MSRCWLAMVALLVTLAVAAEARASREGVDAVLDRVGEALVFTSPGGTLQATVSGLVDVEAYWIDGSPPGLVFSDDEIFIQPRLTVFLDAQIGRRVSAFVQARADRGFDPGSEDPDARLDEYLLRLAVLEPGKFDVQVGKFATVVGGWPRRHDSWHNPFINAPLPYENVTAISDDAAPPSVEAFLARKDLVDLKRRWVPIVWGPSYASGAAAFLRLAPFDFALEVKNAALSSRPSVWNDHDERWRQPTVGGRVGSTPGPAWSLGASASHGPYLRAAAGDSLPAGGDLEDFDQTTVALDMAWSARRFETWGEVFASRFEVPRVGDADTLAYYVEARYKPALLWFAAVRWNQQLFDEVADGAGSTTEWDRDVWRIDLALGLRPARHLQAKLQYGFTERRGPIEQGQQLAAVQLTMQF